MKCIYIKCIDTCKCLKLEYVHNSHVNRCKMPIPWGRIVQVLLGCLQLCPILVLPFQLENMDFLKFHSNSVLISCLGGLPVTLKTSLQHKPVSLFPNGGEEGQGEVTPWVWLVSRPVGIDIQESPLFHLPLKCECPPHRWTNRILTNQPPAGEDGEGEEGMGKEGREASAFLFVGDRLCAFPPPPLPSTLSPYLLFPPLSYPCVDKKETQIQAFWFYQSLQ